jgi:8-oxo-dGTP diphosphatase
MPLVRVLTPQSPSEQALGGWIVPASAPAIPAATHANFVAFHESIEAAEFGGATLGFAVMIPRSTEGVVVVFNRFRRVWELPGGLVDPGESPRAAAVRETREEAGCEARNVGWLGVTEVSDGRTHFGAVFTCDVEVVEFVENEEMSGLAYWSADRPPPGLGATDEALLERFGTR